MKIIPFEKLYSTEFYISEAISKAQNWYNRKNLYSCLGKPKPSHTLLWFKNCRAVITDSFGNIVHAEKNQLAYMSKDIEYTVDFFDTKPNQADSIVIHFQLKDAFGCDIAPTTIPDICIKNVDPAIASSIENAADEFKKNIICVPEINSLIYSIFAYICKKQHKRVIKRKYECIREGIDLLENDSDINLNAIAEICGVSEGHFRRLFKEYSGYNPMEFRQKHRTEKAKQLLLLDTLSIGEIAEELHFSDIYHFSQTFKKMVGVSPQNYIKLNNNPD